MVQSGAVRIHIALRYAQQAHRDLEARKTILTL